MACKVLYQLSCSVGQSVHIEIKKYLLYKEPAWQDLFLWALNVQESHQICRYLYSRTVYHLSLNCTHVSNYFQILISWEPDIFNFIFYSGLTTILKDETSETTEFYCFWFSETKNFFFLYPIKKTEFKDYIQCRIFKSFKSSLSLILFG